MKCRIDIAPEMSAWRAMEKDRVVTSSTKNDGATARRAVGKPRSGKVKQLTFPLRLEIPQTPRDSHFPTAPTTTGE